MKKNTGKWILWALLAGLLVMFGTCDDPGIGRGTISPPTVDKSGLEDLIEEAQELIDNTEIDVNGTGIPFGQPWVTPQTAAALNNAITLAQNIMDNIWAAEEIVETTKTMLQTAMDTFENAKRTGTYTADRTGLTFLIEFAEETKESAVPAASEGDVIYTTMWVPITVANALVDAIAHAQAVVDDPSILDEGVEAAIETLQTALQDFNDAKTPGTLGNLLAAKIAEAKALHFSVASLPANRNESNVAAEFTWVSESAANALNAAIQAQETALLTLTNQGDETARVSTLNSDISTFTAAQRTGTVRLITAGMGASHNSVNGVAFRQSSMATWTDPATGTSWQFTAYFAHSTSNNGTIIFGKRRLDETTFTLTTSDITGLVNNAHNGISLIVDGDGYFHMAVNRHNGQLHYYRGAAPGEFPMNSHRRLMIGTTHGQQAAAESSVTYVEFYKIQHAQAGSLVKPGDLLFAYRQGGSGSGYMVLNRYDTVTQTWHRVHDRLLDGTLQNATGQSFSPYWQMFVDETGRIHLSWTFRETPNVETNSHKYYMYSDNGGSTWSTMSGRQINVPAGPANTNNAAQRAEQVWPIDYNRNLMNQTNMTGEGGRPYILTYFSTTQAGTPNLGPIQYRVIYHTTGTATGGEWKITQVTYRTFNENTIRNPYIGGSGTITSPLSRPRMVVRKNDNTGFVEAFFICRYQDSRVDSVTTADNTLDERRVVMYSTANIDGPEGPNKWKRTVLTDFSVNFWEPSFDTDIWKEHGKLHIFVQSNRGSLDGVADGGNVPNNTTTYPATQVYNLIVDTSNP
ncbi:MAG: BNR-4 repeat-containing protein [Treponema sp.]|nr:BNR-4 repeat-containing protein [Treponema sp.]